MSNSRRLPVSPRASFALLLVLLLAACGGTAGSPPPGSPSPGSPEPSDDAIEHPTGATDVVLRVSTGGGFVPVEFMATSAPHFTLYGDGTVLFRDPFAELPAPIGAGVIPGTPFRIGRLSEDQVQAMLAFALGPGGLGVARPRYENNMIADAPTTTFEVHAGGIDKTVEIYALGEALDPGPDQAARKAFAALADRLAKPEENLQVTFEPYVPAAYRGILIEAGQGVGGQVREWPWPTLEPSDFAMGADPGPGLPRRVLTPAEVAALGLGDVPGGFQGLLLRGPDGRIYSFSLRPLLPDETA